MSNFFHFSLIICVAFFTSTCNSQSIAQTKTSIQDLPAGMSMKYKVDSLRFEFGTFGTNRQASPGPSDSYFHGVFYFNANDYNQIKMKAEEIDNPPFWTFDQDDFAKWKFSASNGCFETDGVYYKYSCPIYDAGVIADGFNKGLLMFLNSNAIYISVSR
jgi:hypothetical protein